MFNIITKNLLRRGTKRVSKSSHGFTRWTKVSSGVQGQIILCAEVPLDCATDFTVEVIEFSGQADPSKLAIQTLMHWLYYRPLNSGLIFPVFVVSVWADGRISMLSVRWALELMGRLSSLTSTRCLTQNVASGDCADDVHQPMCGHGARVDIPSRNVSSDNALPYISTVPGNTIDGWSLGKQHSVPCVI